MVKFQILNFQKGGNVGMSFVANVLENTTVKKFYKSANICPL